MTVREHITRELENLENSPIGTFKTSDIQELSYEGKQEFGKYLGSPGTYTREFRRMRTDGVLDVEKLDRKSRQQVWSLKRVGKTEDHLDDHIDYSDIPF
jgi:truncated hemoglobin YjbI